MQHAGRGQDEHHESTGFGKKNLSQLQGDTSQRRGARNLLESTA